MSRMIDMTGEVHIDEDTHHEVWNDKEHDEKLNDLVLEIIDRKDSKRIIDDAEEQ